MLSLGKGGEGGLDLALLREFILHVDKHLSVEKSVHQAGPLFRKLLPEPI
jgi:hypothetical protein